MKKLALTAGTIMTLAAMAPAFTTTTAFASTVPSTVSQNQVQSQSGADDSLLHQIEALQGQLQKDHNQYERAQLGKALEQFHEKVINEKSARLELETAMTAYKQAVNKYIGHDDGTIVRTLGRANHFLTSAQDALTDTLQRERHNLRAAQVDINSNHLQQAIADIHTASNLVQVRTSTFETSAQGLEQITIEIIRAGDANIAAGGAPTTGSAVGTGASSSSTGSTTGASGN